MTQTAPRSFSTSVPQFKEDRSWVDKGPVTFAELKPYTEHPDGSIDIIDVREPNEVAQGCIPASVNVPLTEFTKAFDVNSDSSASTEFQRKFSFPRPSYDHKIIFYCRSGRRSEQATQIARERGWWKYVFLDLRSSRNYPGSWLDWEKNQKQSDD
ncbi:hypothetical protein MPSI1_000437 [Malassezia psittaci]|uniref:Rhodanese domain-containing protein n=1 Tax=Malassezia psittaci TaxID=1821823 RepID=A0AAF0F8P9_9BASI|nr:hypothetical protein MPSI1_000437 [Malassezia psittaci]